MPRNPTPTRVQRQAEMLLQLQATPTGMTAADMRAALPKCPPERITAGLHRLCALGLVGFMPEAGTGTRGRPCRVHFAREHCPPGAVIAAKPIQLTRPPNRPGSHQTMSIKPASRAQKQPQGEAIYRGVLVTVLPGFERAFAAPKPEPFFAAGKRVEADTWASRVYGSQP